MKAPIMFVQMVVVENIYCSWILHLFEAAGQLEPNPTAPMAPLTLTTNIPFAGSAISRQARRLYIGNIPFGVTEVTRTVLSFRQRVLLERCKRI